jgi:nicotinamide phosphoribosyltransferase
MTLKYNPILAVDSYKLSHAFAYPANVIGMSSYIEARTNGRDVIVPFGLQMFIKKYLMTQVTSAHIDEAEAFAKAHGEPFSREAWQRVIDMYDGYLPVRIYAVPEGMPIRSGNAIVRIDCTDPKLFWLSSYLETALQRAIWYPTTIASMDYSIKKDIAHFYRISGADMGLLPFALHDFGGRGVTSAEQAEIGGAAHLVNFMGSDTVEGVRAANYYYNEGMSAFSVPATEHSVECSFGSSNDEEESYLEHVLNTFAKPGAIVSIVIDGYDVYRAAKTLCTKFKDKIVASGAKVVFRPDSGDMMEVVPAILKMQAEAFGYDTNQLGYKKVRNVGIIQGDGVDHMSIKSLLGKVLLMGFTADNVIFGSGGALLQKVNRDTFKFAQKASAILVKKSLSWDGESHKTEWIPISKNPVTDPGKKSKAGRMLTVRSKVTGEVSTVDQDKPLDVEFEVIMEPIFMNGQLLKEVSLSRIRELANG